MLDTIKYLGFMKTWVSDMSIPTCAITETNEYHKRIKHLGNSEKKLARVVELDLSDRRR